MDDLRNEYTKTKVNKQIKTYKIINYITTNKVKILVIIIVIGIILFPTFSGTLIGDWITNFVGSLVKHISIKL